MMQGQMIITFNNNYLFDTEEIMSQIRELLMEQCEQEVNDCTFYLSGKFDYIDTADAPKVEILSPADGDEVMCAVDWDWKGLRHEYKFVADCQAMAPADNLSTTSPDGADKEQNDADAEDATRTA